MPTAHAPEGIRDMDEVSSRAPRADGDRRRGGNGIALLLLAALPVGLAACGIPKEVHSATLADLEKTRKDLDAERAALEELRRQHDELEDVTKRCKDKLASLGANLKELEQTKGTLAHDLEATQRRMEELRKAHEAAEARAAQFRQLFAKFKSMIDSGKLKVEIRNGLMLVKLSDNILFDPGKTDLKPEGKDALREVSQILAGIQGRKFQVAGHTDNRPLGRHSAHKDNWGLSTARAVEVVQFMVREGGMPGDRLSAAGWADQLPVAANDDEDGRRQNRRIEIVLLPNIEDLPPMDDVLKDKPVATDAAP